MPPAISKEALLAELTRLATELGTSPTVSDMDDQGEYSSRTYTDKFGDWNEALEAAGLEINQRIDIAEENLVAELQRLADELDKTPSKEDMSKYGEYGKSTYMNQFEDWNSALRKADLPPNRGINKKDLIEALQNLAADLGRTPTSSEIEEQCRYSTWAYQERFGSIKSARVEAELKRNVGQPTRRADDEDLLSELRCLSEKVGHPPTIADMRKKGEYSASLYYKHFNSWNRALDLAGLEVQYPKGIDSDELIYRLNDVAEELGCAPTYSEMAERGPHPETFARHFGTWRNAITKAGYEPNDKKSIEVECANCDEVFLRAPSSIREGRQYCSRDCVKVGHSKYLTGEDNPLWSRIEVKCNYCGQTLYRQPNHVKKVKNSYCDAQCRGQYVAENCTGEDNWNWEGGEVDYYGKNWLRKRREARERDDYCCQYCGMTDKEHLEERGTELQVHHIRPIRKFSTKTNANSLENLVTLCWKCHNKWEGIELNPFSQSSN
jgi:5-methylcytosine-specific restriction endonuclease McrA